MYTTSDRSLQDLGAHPSPAYTDDLRAQQTNTRGNSTIAEAEC